MSGGNVESGTDDDLRVLGELEENFNPGDVDSDFMKKQHRPRESLSQQARAFSAKDSSILEIDDLYEYDNQQHAPVPSRAATTDYDSAAIKTEKIDDKLKMEEDKQKPSSPKPSRKFKSRRRIITNDLDGNGAMARISRKRSKRSKKSKKTENSTEGIRSAVSEKPLRSILKSQNSKNLDVSRFKPAAIDSELLKMIPTPSTAFSEYDPAALLEIKPSYSNLKLRKWSVDSFDSCCQDYKRTIDVNVGKRRRRFQDTLNSLAGIPSRSLSSCVNKNDTEMEIPIHVDSDYEDEQNYTSIRGRMSSGSQGYRSNQRPSVNSYSSKSSGRHSRRMGRLSNLLSKSQKSGNAGDSSGKNKTDARRSRAFSNIARKISPFRRKPKAIPPDMVWDPDFRKGAGGLVNKVPQFIPKNKMWSKAANNGMGGLVNKPPPLTSIPPGKIWSRSAFNGQGGVVYRPPEKIPEGKRWDYDALNGLGGLVDVNSGMKPIELEKKKKEIKKNKSKKSKNHDRYREISGRRRHQQQLEDRRRKNMRTQDLFDEIHAQNDEILARVDKTTEAEEAQKEAGEHSNMFRTGHDSSQRAKTDPGIDMKIGEDQTLKFPETKESVLREREQRLLQREKALKEKEAELKKLSESIVSLSKGLRAKIKNTNKNTMSKFSVVTVEEEEYVDNYLDKLESQLEKKTTKRLSEIDFETEENISDDDDDAAGKVVSVYVDSIKEEDITEDDENVDSGISTGEGELERRKSRMYRFGRSLSKLVNSSSKPLESTKKLLAQKFQRNANSNAPTKKKSQRRAKIRKSFLNRRGLSSFPYRRPSQASSHILEETGLEPGHVYRIFNKFETLSKKDAADEASDSEDYDENSQDMN